MKLVGIGLEELGVEEFVKGDFFKGDLYLDTKKEAYKAIGYKRLGIFGALSTILEKKVRALFERAKKENITGNMAGDKFQFGGTLVVDKGGKVLLNYKQESAADHVANDDVLKALGLTPATSGEDAQGAASGSAGATQGATSESAGATKVATSENEATNGAEGAGQKPKVVCEEDVCRLEK